MNINKVCIIGAGNVGVALAVDISNNSSAEVVIVSSKADLLHTHYFKIDGESGKVSFSRNIEMISMYNEELQDVDIVFFTLPSFMVESSLKLLEQFPPKILVFVPGYGGKEFYCKQLIEKGCLVAGFDRSPYVARLSSKHEVVASTKKSVRLGCMTRQHTGELCNLLSAMVDFECHPLDNYLTVALTPSNPILHTARLYSIFKDATADTRLPTMIKFYGEWSDESSKILLDMDTELQKICGCFENIDLSEVIPLSIHYESDSVEALTQKIRSIKSWHNLDSPMKRLGKHYFIDLESRYFQEDFFFGLGILKAHAQIVGAATPTMDMVLCWYQKLSGIKLLNSSMELAGNLLSGGSVPQRFGLKTSDDIERFYLESTPVISTIDVKSDSNKCITP